MNVRHLKFGLLQWLVAMVTDGGVVGDGRSRVIVVGGGVCTAVG